MPLGHAPVSPDLGLRRLWLLAEASAVDPPICGGSDGSDLLQGAGSHRGGLGGAWAAFR